MEMKIVDLKRSRDTKSVKGKSGSKNLAPNSEDEQGSSQSVSSKGAGMFGMFKNMTNKVTTVLRKHSSSKIFIIVKNGLKPYEILFSARP